MKKNFYKILIVNVLTIFILLVIFELCLKYATIKEFPERKYYTYNIELYEDAYKTWKNDWMRKPTGIEYTQEAMIIFGGSFAYGFGLNNNQTMANKISQKLQIPVHNRAVAGGSPAHMLYQLNDENFYKEIPKAKYILYIHTEDEMPRLYRYMEILPSNQIFPRYKLTKEKLEFINTNYLYNKLWALYSVRYIQEKIIEPNCVKNKDKTFELYCAIFKESKEIIEKRYKNTKFIILKYPQFYPDRENKFDCSGEYTNHVGWEKLKQLGFIVVDMKELVGNDLCSPNYIINKKDYHPNEQAWDKIIPKLIEKKIIE